MITVIASAALSPLMVATPVEAAATAPVEPQALYNWETQNATNIVTDEDVASGAQGSFCFIPGGNGMQTVDDWHIC